MRSLARSRSESERLSLDSSICEHDGFQRFNVAYLTSLVQSSYVDLEFSEMLLQFIHYQQIGAWASWRSKVSVDIVVLS